MTADFRDLITLKEALSLLNDDLKKQGEKSLFDHSSAYRIAKTEKTLPVIRAAGFWLIHRNDVGSLPALLPRGYRRQTATPAPSAG